MGTCGDGTSIRAFGTCGSPVTTSSTTLRLPSASPRKVEGPHGRRGDCAWVAVAGCTGLLASGPACGGELVGGQPTKSCDGERVAESWTGKFLKSQSGTRRFASSIRQSGYSSGERTCLVYIPSRARPFNFSPIWDAYRE